MNKTYRPLNRKIIFDSLEEALDKSQADGWNMAHNWFEERLSKEICDTNNCFDSYCLAMLEALQIVKGNRN